MYAAVYMFVFFESLFLTRSTVTYSYSIYESALYPDNVKLKIDGTIELPTGDRKLVEPTDISASTENDYHEDLKYSPQKPVSVFPSSVEEIDEAIDKYNIRKPKSAEGAVVKSRDYTESGFRHRSTDSVRYGTVYGMNYRKVKDDERIRKFTEHIYRQSLQAFEAMKQTSDVYTQKQICSLAHSYKQKFTDFVLRTRQADIKTCHGTRNVLLHILETSTLMLKRIVNFLKANMLPNGAMALRGGGKRLDKVVENVKKLEYEHACKKFGVCRTTHGFRFVLLDIISILLKLPDEKLIQVNDAATEIVKHADLSPISETDAVHRVLKRAIKSLEKTDAQFLRSSLTILYGALSRSHLPLVANEAVFDEKMAVKQTVSFHGVIDALEEALPPTETNKREWATAIDRMKRWAAGHPLDLQEILQALFDNVMKGVSKSTKIKQFVAELAKPYAY